MSMSFYEKLSAKNPRLAKAMEVVKSGREDNLDLSGEIDFARAQLVEAMDITEQLYKSAPEDSKVAVLQMQQPSINSALDRITRVAEKAAKIRVVSDTYLSLQQQEQVMRAILDAASRVFNRDEDSERMERFTKEIEEISVFSKNDARGNVTINL